MPKMIGRMMNEALGKWHVRLTFIGVYCIFIPIHYLGIAANVRRSAAFRDDYLVRPVREGVGNGKDPDHDFHIYEYSGILERTGKVSGWGIWLEVSLLNSGAGRAGSSWPKAWKYRGAG